MAVQTAIVAALVLLYNFSSALLALSFLVGYSAVVYALTSELTPIDVLWSMQAANVPLIVVSKVRLLENAFVKGLQFNCAIVNLAFLFGTCPITF